MDALALRSPLPGDDSWVIQRHGVLYAEEYGFDISFEALVARIVADFAQNRDTARERAWIAVLDGARVGSVFCVGGSERAVRHPSRRPGGSCSDVARRGAAK